MSQAFNVLLQEFAAAHGLPSEDSAYGLEFECEGLGVYLVGHPLHPDRVLVEVQVAVLPDDPDPARLALLLQINEAARFEHDWVITMDGQMQVSLSTSAELAQLTVQSLESLMLDGVERGLLLKDLLSSAADAAAGDDDAAAPSGDALIIRG
jgi:hypothetical protein